MLRHFTERLRQPRLLKVLATICRERHNSLAPKISRLLPGSLDGENDLFGLAAPPLVVEVDPAIDALVRPFFLLHQPGADEPQRPPLELIRVISRQGHGIR